MNQGDVARKLAAIMIADVVGYTRLMERNEAGTHARLKVIRNQIVGARIAQTGGRIIRTAGDGMLAEFGSATAALRCAVEIQREMEAKNRPLAPEERITFRIGINLGDIIVDGDDIAGDGVNIAARLETLAEPGGICISGAVREQVHEKLDVGFDDIGEQHVKNIERPIHVYRVALGGGASEARRSVFPARRKLPLEWGRWAAGLALLVAVALGVWLSSPLWKPALPPASPPMSLAVLPFAAPSGDPADERFADALTRDLTTAVGRWRIARVASFGLVGAYKGRTIDPRIIGRELDSRYLVEGDIRMAAEKATVTTRLVETGTGTQIWSVQRELSPRQVTDGPGESAAWLANRLRTHMYAAEKQRAARLPKDASTPMDMVLQAEAMFDADPSIKSSIEARRRLNEVLHLDRDFLPAIMSHARLNLTELELGGAGIGQERLEQVLHEADTLSARAVELAPDYAAAWDLRTAVYSFQQRWDPALEASAVSLKLDPSDSLAHVTRARLLLMNGQAAASLPLTDKAIALDPLNSGFARLIQCHDYLLLGRAADAIASCEQAIGQVDLEMVYVYLGAAYAQKGEITKASLAKDELLKRAPKVSIERLRALFVTWSNHPVFQQLTEETVLAGLRKAGLSEK